MHGEGKPPGSDVELILHDVQLEGADFSARRFEYVSIGVGSRLTKCDFRRSKMLSGGIGDGMQQSDYFGCVFDGCYLRGISPGRAAGGSSF